MAFLTPLTVSNRGAPGVKRRCRRRNISGENGNGSRLITCMNSDNNRHINGVRRRAVLQTAALTALSTAISATAVVSPVFASEPDSEVVTLEDRVIKGTELAQVTDKVYLDVKIAGTLAGRIYLGLFGGDAPLSVGAFKEACGTGIKGRAGRTAGYKGSVAARVSPTYVELGRVKQIDELNQSPGTPQRQTRAILPPENRESNNLSHDTKGILSVKRGGGAFEFIITTAQDPTLDTANLVIGKVLDTADSWATLDKMANVPTTQKTMRDGFRNVGRAIGDARAKVDLEDKPLQKIQIADCAVLST